MKARTWWLRLVGVFYLVLGIPAVAMALMSPGAGTRPVELFAFLHWVVLGGFAVSYARTPQRATVLMTVIVTLELLAWVPTDIVAIVAGWGSAASLAPLMVVHLVIGLSGIVALRGERDPDEWRDRGQTGRGPSTAGAEVPGPAGAGLNRKVTAGGVAATTARSATEARRHGE